MSTKLNAYLFLIYIKMIKEICDRYNIKNYTINSDGSIDVDGDVSLSNYDLDKMPLKFNKVKGHFVISLLGIETLEGCPEYVGGDFIISLNMIRCSVTER